MSLARKFAVFVLTVLLTSTLVTGNLLVAAHLTVLDPSFVNEAVEEEGGYEIVEDVAVQAATSEVPPEINETVDTETLVRDSVSQAYLQRQTERNIQRLYAYLHSDTDTLNLSVDTRPLKENASKAVEAQVRNATIAELLEQTGTELPGPVNQSTVERLTANESSYEGVRSEFRQRVRERVLDEAVAKAYNETSNDEKLYLVIPDYDPREYTEEEKAQMVADNETEIRTALRDRIEEERGDEIDEQVDTTLAQVNETATANTTGSDGVEAAALSIQSTFVEGLTNTNMSYDEFQSDLNASKAQAAQAAGNQTRATLDDQLSNQLDLTEAMGPEATQGLEPVRTGVTWLDRMAIILPVLALLLIGLVYFATRSVQTVASSLGFGLLSAGFPIYLALGFLQSFAEQTVNEQIATMEGDTEMLRTAADLLLGLLGQLFGRVGAVSLAFVAAGVLVLGAWLALRAGVIGAAASEDGRTAREAATEAAREAEAPVEERESDDAVAATATADDVGTVDDPADGETEDPLADAGDDTGGE